MKLIEPLIALCGLGDFAEGTHVGWAEDGRVAWHMDYECPESVIDYMRTHPRPYFGPEHYDKGDPAFHGSSGQEAVAGIHRRHDSWLARQDEEIQNSPARFGPLHASNCPCKPRRHR
jgi:hypothetical protein